MGKSATNMKRIATIFLLGLPKVPKMRPIAYHAPQCSTILKRVLSRASASPLTLSKPFSFLGC
ncbi:hypothetical protein JavanS729_0006 [Streptococcus satellite phage Javan729]|nr:hypothetical protein JavanS729_0006 [Streptococcus satellite phage Javan729]